MKKKCFKCGVIKELSEFYAHPQMGDGHLNKCKDCTKKDSKKRGKLLYSDPKTLLQERARGREKYHRLYKGNGNNGSNEAKKNYMERNKDKKACYILYRSALARGKISKQPCEICGDIKVSGHHDDYTEPLKVRWLCVKHHNEYHVKKREKELEVSRI